MTTNYLKNIKNGRKLGFWDYMLGISLTGAAVKIVKTVVNAKAKATKYASKADKDVDILQDPDRPINYPLYSSDRLADVIRARRKAAELADLYGSYTVAEHHEVMGIEDEFTGINYIVNGDSKYAIRPNGKMFTLYTQEPMEVCDDEFGEEDLAEKTVSE